MEVQINLWAVLLATLSSMVVGAIWYAKSFFGTAWMKLAKVDKKRMEKGGVAPMIMTVIVSFLTAYVLAHVTYLANSFFQNSFMGAALTTAFWLWLGFIAARFVTHDAFEGRPMKLTLLNISHELVTILIMAVIIGWLQP